MADLPYGTKRPDDQPALLKYPRYTGILQHQPEWAVRSQLLECLDYFGVGSRALPGLIEAAYRRRFAAYRLAGEWFARAPEVVAEVERLAA
jgi:hypothetical protein